MYVSQEWWRHWNFQIYRVYFNVKTCLLYLVSITVSNVKNKRSFVSTWLYFSIFALKVNDFNYLYKIVIHHFGPVLICSASDQRSYDISLWRVVYECVSENEICEKIWKIHWQMHDRIWKCWISDDKRMRRTFTSKMPIERIRYEYTRTTHTTCCCRCRFMNRIFEIHLRHAV